MAVTKSYGAARWELQELIRNRSTIDVDPVAIKARTDFLLFRWYVRRHRSYTHQVGWAKRLNTGIDSKVLNGCAGDNTLLLAPRGSTKSTFLTEWVAWQIGIHTAPDVKLDFKVLYVSYNVDVSLLKSIEIKRIIESAAFQRVFPWVRPGKKWSDKVWEIDKRHAGLSEMGEPYTLAVAGLTGAVASKRAHLICLDDLIKSPQDIENPTVREKMSYNWTSVIRPTMFEGGRAVCLGTRMSALDIYASTFTIDRGWDVIEESAIVVDADGNERSYWPKALKDEGGGFTLSFLQWLREDDLISFSFQFQNKVLKDGQIIIDPDWLVDEAPPDHFDELGIGLDLSASKKEKADYTVFVLVGKKGDTYWILDMKRGRWSGNIDKCSAFLAMCLEWGIVETDDPWTLNRYGQAVFPEGVDPTFNNTGIFPTLFPESKGYQVSFKSDFVGFFEKYGINSVMVKPLDIPGDKLMKLRGVSGVFQRGKVRFNKYRNFKVAKQELENHGSTTHDDCEDAIVLALWGMGVRPRLSVG